MDESASSRQRYEDFEVLVDSRTADGYPVSVTRAPAGDARDICQLAPSSTDLQAALVRIESEDTDASFLLEIGHHLFDGLFVDKVANAFQASLHRVQGQGKGLRVRLHLKPPELAALPWEYMYFAAEDRQLAISVETPLVRYIPTGHFVRPTAVSPPLRLLVVISNPVDTHQLDAAQEKQIIQQALHSPVSQEWLRLQFIEHATVAEINQAMRSFQPHVFHFIGHGQYVEGEAYLVLEDAEGEAHPMSERSFREFFSGINDTRVAVLNACQSATTSSTQPMTGIAPRLLQRHLSAVVAMQYSMPDRSAQIFSREFYRSLALGYPVDAAIVEARRGIFLEVGDDVRDWGIPVLFLRARDGQLFEMTESPAQSRPVATESAFDSPESELPIPHVDPDNPPFAVIRELLKAAFTPQSLQQFCQERPDFRPILANFGPGQGMADMVDRVIEHCEMYLLWEDLLAEVAKVNPRQYAHFVSRI